MAVGGSVKQCFALSVVPAFMNAKRERFQILFMKVRYP
jgi:hypothetical protein